MFKQLQRRRDCMQIAGMQARFPCAGFGGMVSQGRELPVVPRAIAGAGGGILPGSARAPVQQFVITVTCI